MVHDMNVFKRKLDEAFRFAQAAHAGQLRGDGVTPYVFHCIDVAKAVEASWPNARHAIIAGMLHDVLEDTAVTHGEIEFNFGWRVANIVGMVTDPGDAVGEERYRRQLDSYPLMPSDALMVKWADKTSNLQEIVNSPPRWSDKKIEKNKARLVEHVKAISAELSKRGLIEVAA